METRVYALRLHPGQDLKKELVRFTKENNLQAAFIITCVGSLRQAGMRLAGQSEVASWRNKFEIISLTGTLCQDGVHLHIGISDSTGILTIGGHLMDGNIIYTTAEIIIGEARHLKFSRKLDPATSYPELFIEKR